MAASLWAAKEAISEKDVPEAVIKAVKEAFPGATIDGQEVQKNGPATLYFIEVEEMGKPEKEVAVATDGTIVEIETEAALKDFPEAARKAIEKAAEGAKITEVATVEIRAEFRKEGDTTKLVKLEKARVLYGADLVKGDMKGDIRVAEDGTVVQPLKWEKKAAKPEKPKD
jgi:ribonuclease I